MRRGDHGTKGVLQFPLHPDCWRAAQVRNIGAVEGNHPVSDNDWRTITNGGEHRIQNFIDAQMADKSCAIVLIGHATAGRKWINYEIRKAWNDKKGVVGIYFWRSTGAAAFSVRPAAVEAAIVHSGFVIDEHVSLTSEWGERAEKSSGAGTRRLLHAARLRRDPDRYIGQFGETAYRIMLGDCLWHVYRMIGKLSGSAYVFSKSSS